MRHTFCCNARARLQGKKVVFVTNNSTKSRAGYLSKFTSLGLKVAAEEIYSSSYAAAAYLESINFPKDKKARFLPVHLQASSYYFLHACRQYTTPL